MPLTMRRSLTCLFTKRVRAPLFVFKTHRGRGVDAVVRTLAGVHASDACKSSQSASMRLPRSAVAQPPPLSRLSRDKRSNKRPRRVEPIAHAAGEYNYQLSTDFRALSGRLFVVQVVKFVSAARDDGK